MPLSLSEPHTTASSAASPGPERILLRASPKMLPLEYLPEADAEQAMGTLKALVFDKRDFLMLAATGATKQKRKAGTDSENVLERICTQVIVTAIEPFLDGELIERTTDIEFGKQFFNERYIEATSLESQIAAHRNLIWSAFFKILAHTRKEQDYGQR